MARTTTRTVTIDGREFKIAKLTIGSLRELAEEEKAGGDDPFAVLTVQLKAVQAAMKRAGIELALDELERMTDSEDLARAHAAVMALTTGREAATPPGEPASP